MNGWKNKSDYDMEANEMRDQLRLDLERINFWIVNADQKAGTILAILGVVVPIVGSTDKVIEIIAEAIKPLVTYYKGNTEFPFSNLIFAFLILICILLLGISVYYLLATIVAKTDPKVFKEKDLVVESLLHYQSINKLTFSNYKRLRVEQMEKNDEESKDFLSQIYINSDICTSKYENYNRGLCFLRWFLFSFVITCMILIVYYISITHQ